MVYSYEVFQEVWSMILPSIIFKISFGLVSDLKDHIWVSLFGETNNKKTHSHVWASSVKYEVLLGIIESGLG